MSKAISVLIVEDSEDDSQLLLLELRRGGYEPAYERVQSRDKMMDALKSRHWDLIVADHSMPHFNTIDAMKVARESGKDVPFIIVSGTMGEEEAVAAMKAGAQDYIMKHNLKRLIPAIQRELHEAKVRRERKEAQEALNESENLFRSLSSSSPLGILLTDTQGRCLYTNPRCREIFDFGLLDSLGEGWNRIVAPEDRAPMMQEWNACVQEGREFSREFRAQTPRGAQRWVHMRASRLLTEDEKHGGYVATVEDVTDRKRTEEALRESEARFKTFMDHTLALVFIVDEEGRFVYVNRRWYDVFGRQHEDVSGRTFFDVWPADVSTQLIQSNREVLTSDKPRETYETIPVSDGQPHEWLVVKFPLDDPTGKRVLGNVAIDVTERRQLEDQLRQAQKMEAIGQLAGGVAHDFNNLLAAIIGFGEISLRKMDRNDPLYRNVEEMKKAGERAAGLTRQLLAFSRKQMLEPKIVDLNTIIGDMQKMLQRLIREDIELVFEPAADLRQIKADPGQIEQVVMNLVVNARDAMPQGGKVTVQTVNVTVDENYIQHHAGLLAGEYALVQIRDTGTGISDEVKKHLFEPFFTTKPQGQGTGLGLATCYGIVKQSGGHIDVESEVGKGTTFRIYLPCAEEETTVAHARPTQQAHLPLGTETVLLVEDEPALREMASLVLSELGYSVIEAADGEVAMQIANEYQGDIHILITDVVMPRMGGKQLAESLKSKRSKMRVLFTSGYTANAIVHHGVLDSGIMFLQKPFTPTSLAHKVREVLK